MRRKHDDTVIDIATAPVRMGLRGRIDRLCQEYTMKAQALRIASEIIDDDDRRLARETVPKKFLHAINQRNGDRASSNGNGNGNGHAKRPAEKKPNRRVPAAIAGKRLTLFLLEHLDDSEPRSVRYMVDQLAAAGSPIERIQSLNGPLSAVLVRRGFAKRDGEGLIRRTAKGAKLATSLRATLETTGAVAQGGYMRP